MFKKKILLILATLSIMFLVACSDESAEADETGDGDGNSFYNGENLETVVPFSAGGGSDVLARYVAPFLAKHIEGSPSVQVTNIPGAGSVIGMNEYVGMRDPDGYNTVWTSGSTIINHLLEAEGVNYEFSDLTPILGVPAGGVLFISSDTGYEEPKDLLNPDISLIYAGQSETGLDLVPLVSFEVLDIDVQTVLGYEGYGPARVAFEQGEATLNYQTTGGYLANVTPLVESGEAIPLFTFGHYDEEGNIIRDPAFPDIPHIKEFYEAVHGEEPSGEAWDTLEVLSARAITVQKVFWTKNEAPEEAIQALKDAAVAIEADSSFVEDGDEVLGGYEPIVGDELDRLVENILQKELDPEVKDWIFTFLEENF